MKELEDLAAAVDAQGGTSDALTTGLAASVDAAIQAATDEVARLQTVIDRNTARRQAAVDALAKLQKLKTSNATLKTAVASVAAVGGAVAVGK